MKSLLLSYPRSGNHWVRFIVEWFSSRPTQGLSHEDQPIYKSLFNKEILSHVTGEDYILYKSHFIPGHPNVPQFEKNDIGKLILIIRNPKECIFRHTKGFKLDDIEHYMSLIKFYDNYSGEKLLVYYEDLLSNPSSSINNITYFLKIEDNEKNKLFMEKYHIYHKESVLMYDKSKGGSSTKGANLLYHSKRIRKQKIALFNNHINKNYADYIKYISRYL